MPAQDSDSEAKSIRLQERDRAFSMPTWFVTMFKILVPAVLVVATAIATQRLMAKDIEKNTKCIEKHDSDIEDLNKKCIDQNSLITRLENKVLLNEHDNKRDLEVMGDAVKRIEGGINEIRHDLKDMQTAKATSH